MEAGVLAEAAAMPWRRRASERSLGREGRIWTLWSVGILVTFGLPAALLIWIQPLAFPVSAIFLGHGVAVLHLQARRGARGVKPIGAAASPADRAALGLLGDLVGHDARGLLHETGLTLQRGRLGSWLVGQEGAILVRIGCTVSACGWARPGICRRATGWRICCSRCAKTRRDSRRSPTGTSLAPPGACGHSSPSGAVRPSHGRSDSRPRSRPGA